MQKVNPMPTIKFFTLGCKVNQYETQAMRERFLSAGFKEIDNGHPADYYLINTCTVTARDDQQSLQLIRKAKNENPRAKIIACGCLVELDSDRIRAIDKKISLVKNCAKKNILSGKPKKNGISYFKGHTRAFLKVQDGCNNFCAYCKVPLVRGSSRSRKKREIVQEAGRLVAGGVKEIVLTGICLGAYGRDLKPKISLVELIKELEKISGLLRIRLSSIEAGDCSDELIGLMVKSDKLCRHLHIPLQSGDDTILTMMNRRYRRKGYLALIKKIKIRIPHVAITTDCLVGFPGEEEQNFAQTVKLIRAINPLRTHIFPYSPREGTAAFVLKSELGPETIKKRAAYLRRVAEYCAAAYKSKFLGKKMEVLFECRNHCLPDYWEGHTGNYLKVLAKSNLCLRNQVVPVRLKQLSGDLILAQA